MPQDTIVSSNVGLQSVIAFQGQPTAELISEIQARVNTKMAQKATKRRYSLIPWESVRAVVDVAEFGATKYAPHAWRKFDYDVFKEAAARHMAAIMEGEIRDPETGFYHAAHLGCCVLFMLHFALKENK